MHKIGLAISLILTCSGCAKYQKQWEKAQNEILPPHHNLEGSWVGSWESAPSGHSGKLKCIIKESDNGPKVLGVLEKGAMFGEMALIDNKPRMASAKAINGPVELLIVSKANFQKKMDQLDPFTRGLIKFMAEIVR